MAEITQLVLGTVIIKYELPTTLVNDINKSYDDSIKNLPAHNDQLAGKIQEEKLVNDIITEEMKGAFLGCFQQYLSQVKNPRWVCSLDNAWINEMKSGEYNPMHYHTSKQTDLGLSSVLMLKRPSTYGKEASKEKEPSNGYLDILGGDQSPLSISQLRVDAQVGDFYVFPYTMLHGVYPFNGTDEVRRTLSYNCNLLKPTIN